MSVEFAREGTIAIITLNRPEKLNAMTPEMYAEITRRLQEVDGDDDIWVGIITGAGTRAFSAGADLTTLHQGEAGPGIKWHPLRQDRFDMGLPVSKPLIAAIEGYCLAGGLELALICDIRRRGGTFRLSRGALERAPWLRRPSPAPPHRPLPRHVPPPHGRVGGRQGGPAPGPGA
jgi:enoyl-CoA hydratase/carnithine racemase